MEDLKSLVARARAGDHQACGEIVRRFRDMAYGYAYSILGDFHLAEDAAQEAFADALAQLENLREPSAFPGWFRRIVFKHCDRQTRHKRPPAAPLEAAAAAPSGLPGPEEAAEKSEIQGAVLSAIASLPENERVVTTLFYIDGYSQREVAEFLELPVTTVNNRLKASRDRLKERMMTMVAGELKSRALPDDFTRRVLARYGIAGVEPADEVYETLHRGRIRKLSSADEAYALKVHHEYMTAETIEAVEAVRAHLRKAGFPTPGTIATRRGKAFVEVEGRFCGVHEWVEGRTSSHDSRDDLAVVAEMQGRWIEAMKPFDDGAAAAVLARPRQRKDWAWIVPLDRLSDAVPFLEPVEKVRRHKTSARYHETYLACMDEVESRFEQYMRLLEEVGAASLPHGVTHGDFWHGNVLLTGGGAVVIDLDLCSFEPRLADFARLAAWKREFLGTEGIAKLFARLRSKTAIADAEIESVPVLMAAHYMYYLLFHCILYVLEDEEDEGSAGYLVEALPGELKAFDETVGARAEIAEAVGRV